MNYWRDMAPSEVNFLIFSSVWSIISIVYLVVAPMKFPKLAHKLMLLGCDGLAMTFWFAGFVALAVFLSSRICFGNVCNVAKASVGFAALQWYVIDS
jgi:Membrane-associating domain